MKECTQAIDMAAFPHPPIVKSIWWILRHFVLAVLLLIAGAWDFLLWSTTMLRFDRNIQDFGRFYYATKAYLDGQDMYGPTRGTFLPISPLFGEHLWDLNPPHFHLLFYPLIIFSPHEALTIWASASILAFMFCCYLIISELRIKLSFSQWGLLAFALLALSSTGFLIRTAQVSLLLMVPVTLAWLSARKSNWCRSGFYLGLLASTKLFFLIFLPYFLLRRQFRGAAALVISCLSCFILGLLVFGVNPYISWIKILNHIDWAGGSTNASLFGFLTRGFSDGPHFQPINANLNFYPAWIILAGLLGIVTVLASASDSSLNAIDRGFSILLVGAILISPLGWTYYLLLPLGPLVALAYSCKESGSFQRAPLQLRSSYLRNALLILGMPGLFFPSTMGAISQPNALATIFIASIYFWSTLFIWAALICDWHLHKEVSQTLFSSSGHRQIRPE